MHTTFQPLLKASLRIMMGALSFAEELARLGRTTVQILRLDEDETAREVSARADTIPAPSSQCPTPMVQSTPDGPGNKFRNPDGAIGLYEYLEFVAESAKRKEDEEEPPTVREHRKTLPWPSLPRDVDGDTSA